MTTSKYEVPTHTIALKINNIPNAVPIKRVFSSNVFIPMNPKISNKTLLYYTGFIRLVETFKARTHFNSLSANEKWYLYIYVDDMFYREYEDDKYTKSDANNSDNKTIKESYEKNKDNLLKIHKLFKLYIEYIETHKNEYDFIRIYSFDFPEVVKKNKGFLGHPDTLGSIVRAEPLYDTTIDYVFMININHAITPKLMELIDDWVESDKMIVMPKGYGWYVQHPYELDINGTNLNKIIQPLNITYNLNGKLRIAAGLFGYKRDLGNPNKHIEYDYKIFINPKNDISVYRYGFDELILGVVFTKITTKAKSEPKIHEDILRFDESIDKNNNPFRFAEYALKDNMLVPKYVNKNINGMDCHCVVPDTEDSANKKHGRNYGYGNYKDDKYDEDDNNDNDTDDEQELYYSQLYVHLHNTIAKLKANNPKIAKYTELLKIMDEVIEFQAWFHRFISVSFLKDLPPTTAEFLMTYFTKRKNYKFKSLLGSPDEYKTYFICLDDNYYGDDDFAKHSQKTDTMFLSGWEYIQKLRLKMFMDRHIDMMNSVNKSFEKYHIRKRLTDYSLNEELNKKSIQELFNDTIKYYKTQIILNPYTIEPETPTINNNMLTSRTSRMSKRKSKSVKKSVKKTKITKNKI
jgi:hypothetical protein